MEQDGEEAPFRQTVVALGKEILGGDLEPPGVWASVENRHEAVQQCEDGEDRVGIAVSSPATRAMPEGQEEVTGRWPWLSLSCTCGFWVRGWGCPSPLHVKPALPGAWA